MQIAATLSIQEFSFLCSLGVSDAERSIPQEVRVSLRIEFPNLPRGCETDILSDTICYADLCEQIKAVAALKSYKLVEHLAFEISENLKTAIPEGCRFFLNIHKVKPPIDGLRNGVQFEIGIYP